MKKWWKELVAYQVYLKSFKDSNDDGIGDIRGLISKLDYLADLGIGLIWLSPMYESPNDDNGYDISDYYQILKDYGTMEDFDNLLANCHERNIKLIIDLVINHTSDEHPWFLESKDDKLNAKRDYYIWREPVNNKEPNNWESIFKGSAWEYNENTKDYYLHLFSKKQPDLNWENEHMRRDIYHMIRWWLDKGIDGFRVDAISHIKKEPCFKDLPNPKKLDYVPSFDSHMNVEGIHAYLGELKSQTYGQYDVVTVGEANGVSADNIEDLKSWIGEEEGAFDMVFQFDHLGLWDRADKEAFDLVKFKKALSKWQYNLEGIGWNALYIENHDQPRVVSIWGDEGLRKESAKAFAMTYFLQKGTPFIYQGQEIGMTNPAYDDLADYEDCGTQNEYRDALEQGWDHDQAMAVIKLTSRVNSRSPMQWNADLYGGFSKVHPWAKINPNYPLVNVELESQDSDSILNFYKKLIQIRNQSETLIYGEYKLLMPRHSAIYAYERQGGDEKYLMIANLISEDTAFKFPYSLKQAELCLSNYDINESIKSRSMLFRPYECRLYKINQVIPK